MMDLGWEIFTIAMTVSVTSRSPVSRNLALVELISGPLAKNMS